MNTIASLIAEHSKICQVEFNNRQYSIRKAIKICRIAGLELIDVISDAKVHIIVIKDMYYCVSMLGGLVGTNVYEHIDLDHNDVPIGVKVIRHKDIQYLNHESQKKHVEYQLEQMRIL